MRSCDKVVGKKNEKVERPFYSKSHTFIVNVYPKRFYPESESPWAGLRLNKM